MGRRIWLCWLAALLAVGIACDEDPAGPTDSGPDPGLVGTVVDTEGQPIAGAPVGLIYGADSDYLPDWPPDEADSEVCGAPGGIGFGFLVELTCQVTARVLDHRERVVYTFCEDKRLQPGVHSFTWRLIEQDSTRAPNGAYTFQARTWRSGLTDVQEISGIYLNAFSYDYSNCVGAIAITDVEGGFRVPYAEMPIGEEVRCGNGGVTCIIPDTVWIQAAVPGARGRQLLRLMDLEIDQELTLTLEPTP
jgi:hypothetical protein